MHGRVAFLPWIPITLKALIEKDAGIEPRTLGEHLKRRRLQLNVTQKQVAHLLGVTSWTVSNWEKARTDPSIDAMPALMRFLGYYPFPERRDYLSAS